MVNLADLVEHLLDVRVSREAVAGLLDLVRGFEQERLELAFGETAVEIKEGAVFRTGTVAVAVGFATLHETLDEGGVEDFWGKLKRAQQVGLALAQGQGGGAGEGLYLTHIYM